MTLTCRNKTHSNFPKEIDFIENYILNKNKRVIHSSVLNMFNKKSFSEAELELIYNNVNDFTSNIIENYKNILFICGDYPGYGGAATNCFRLQRYFKRDNTNTFGFYFNFKKGENAKYEKHEEYIIDDIDKLGSIIFQPDLIILKSPCSFDLKNRFQCPVYYLVGGIYTNDLDKYYYDISTLEEQNKYINHNVLEQIKKYDKTYVNSYHTQEILLQWYNIKTDLFLSSFISHSKNIFKDPHFNARKYEFGLIVSNFNRKIKILKRIFNY